MAKILTLAKGIALSGEIHAESSVRFEGHFEGNGLIKGTLYIVPGAFWEGSLIAEQVIIQGVFAGNISAQRVIMFPGARVSGTVLSPLVQIKFGAVFTGLLRMRSERKALVDHLVNTAVPPSNLQQIAGT